MSTSKKPRPGRSSESRTQAAASRESERAVEELGLPTGRIVDETVFGPSALLEAQVAERVEELLQAPDPLSTLMPSSELFEARDALRESLTRSSRVFSTQAAQAVSPWSLESNVIGFGVGPKFSMGSFTGEMAVQVFVRQKLPFSQLDEAELVPGEIDGVPTDVLEAPLFEAQVVFNRLERPSKCGGSLGHVEVTAGTQGCLVPHESRADLCYILSNNHVLANANGSRVGDVIVQPGRVDPAPRQELALLARSVDLQAGPPGGFGAAPANVVDAALALTRRDLVSPSHHGFTINPTPVRAATMMNVCKEGRTTGFTSGRILSLGVETSVKYQVFQGGQLTREFLARFVNQIIIQHDNPFKPFSLGGDSGSLIVTLGTKQPVGLLFAGGPAQGGGHMTLANPIDEVMSRLNFRSFLAQ